mmetsp:Transcript_11224/g.38227  ORF Transcript_11224/g.38227 Transcript_11224/m.38227 type:complete len:205 (-) Transcript_11224:3130-3744(-)
MMTDSLEIATSCSLPTSSHMSIIVLVVSSTSCCGPLLSASSKTARSNSRNTWVLSMASCFMTPICSNEAISATCFDFKAWIDCALEIVDDTLSNSSTFFILGSTSILFISLSFCALSTSLSTLLILDRSFFSGSLSPSPLSSFSTSHLSIISSLRMQSYTRTRENSSPLLSAHAAHSPLISSIISVALRSITSSCACGSFCAIS